MLVPTPIAGPPTAATIGFWLFSSDPSRYIAACGLSLPDVNTPERPPRTRQRIAGSDCAESIASLMARHISSVRRFLVSGRDMMMVRVPSLSLTVMCSLVPRRAGRSWATGYLVFGLAESDGRAAPQGSYFSLDAGILSSAAL